MAAPVETRQTVETLPGDHHRTPITYQREFVSNGHGGQQIGPYWYAYYRPRIHGVAGRLRSLYIGRRWRSVAEVLRRAGRSGKR